MAWLWAIGGGSFSAPKWEGWYADPDRQLVTSTTLRRERHYERTEISPARTALRRHQAEKG